jgi:hypothetical protein
MKCISCGTDNNLRDRTAHYGRCKNCNHTFVFDPTNIEPFKFTDVFFAKAISDISANNTLYFTSNQLYYLLCKRLNKGININSNFMTLGGFFIIFGIIAFAVFANTLIVICFLIIGILLILAKFTQKKQKELLLIPTLKFEVWLSRWQTINNTISKKLPDSLNESQATTINPDITAYSFDRLVVCDNAEIAQMLIANNFHFENNCAVLSITGYPQSIFNTVLEMLRRNPDLKVYALHDASPNGVSLVHQLTTSSNWFRDSNVVIFDLGLMPRQILSNRNMFVLKAEESAQQSQNLPEAVRQNLSVEELKWLDAGNFVELESFTPRKILQVVTQGIAKSRDPNSGDSLVDITDLDSVGGDVYIFESDSFG